MMMIQNKKARIVIEYFGLAVGTGLLAFSLVFFLEPNTIAPGGVTGFAILLQRMLGIPIDFTNLAVNIPLFIIGILLLGKAFGAKTAFSTIMLSAFIRFFYIFFGENISVTDDLLLAAIYGGVISGIGLGIVFRYGGTTGGTDLGGAILNKYFPGLSTSKLMMGLDLMVVVAAGIVERRVETSLYSIIALYILVKLIDFIVEGLSYAKAFYIISNNPEIISKRITIEMNRGVTALAGKGVYTGTNRDVLLCVVNRSQVLKLKKIVHEVDPRAFMMVTTTHEVLGEGFKEDKN